MTPADDHGALLRAIHDAPDNDLLKAVYADWLEEYGDPVHATQARSPRRLRVWRRGVEWHLSPNHGAFPGRPVLKSGAEGVAGALGVRADACVVQHGFVVEITSYRRAWYKYGPGLVREFPLRRVELTDCSPQEYAGGGAYWNLEGYGVSSLEADVWQHLPDWDADFSALKGVYRDTRRAYDALSVALLAWAKEGG